MSTLRSQRYPPMSSRRFMVLSLPMGLRSIQINSIVQRWVWKFTFFPQRVCFLIIYLPTVCKIVASQYKWKIIYKSLNLHVNGTCPHHADFIFYCIQYSSRTGHLNTEKYYKDRLLKMRILQQLQSTLHKYFTFIFLKQELRYKKSLRFPNFSESLIIWLRSTTV